MPHSGPRQDTRRLPLPGALVQVPVIPVLRAAHPDLYAPVVDTLIEAGILCVELTLTTPGTIAALPDLVKRSGAAIGVGTITNEAQAEEAAAAGAAFLVTPVAHPGVVGVGIDHGIPVIPGGLTPTELFSLWEAGASAVKIFPAQTVAPEYGAHLRGPFPDLQFIPSGGIGLADIPGWLDAGAAAVSLGGPLLGDALRGGSRHELAKRAEIVLQQIEEWRAGR